jgi:hypothetical protein
VTARLVSDFANAGAPPGFCPLRSDSNGCNSALNGRTKRQSKKTLDAAKTSAASCRRSSARWERLETARRVRANDAGVSDFAALPYSRWMIYTEILARPNSGSFRWRYTFERTTESITYTFRVAIPTTGVAGYPYEPVASPPRSVHVDP